MDADITGPARHAGNDAGAAMTGFDPMGRCIILDTETTGLYAPTGDRIVEIAALEIVGLLPTKRFYHVYCNPERDVPPAAVRVHGLTREFLSDKPRFADIANGFLEFVGDSPIIAHNAPFDFGFLNAELSRARKPELARLRMIDTLVLARRMFPGQRNTLDDLCRRFNISLSIRAAHHRADIDIKLLADVYLELNGGRHLRLDLESGADNTAASSPVLPTNARTVLPARDLGLPSQAEIARHAEFVGQIKSSIWSRVQTRAPEPADGLAALGPGTP